LEILDDSEKEVVVGRFGLELGGEERTQREIAKELASVAPMYRGLRSGR
jgi:RNA polymerase sporulation-specific sigma factor